MQSLEKHVQGFERYMQTSTTWLASTRMRYAFEVRLFAKVMRVSTVEEISPALILEWNTRLHDAHRATGTFQQKHAALKAFFSYLDDFQLSTHAAPLLRAMRHIKAPRATPPKRQPYALEDHQLQRLVEAAGAKPGVGVRDCAIIHFLRATGARRFEVTGVLAEDVDLKRRIATIMGKGAKPRTVVFDQACKDALVRWLPVRANSAPKCPNLFISVDGMPLHETTINGMVNGAAKRAGIRKGVWTHLFRHTRLTGLLDGGMTLQDAAAFAGHSNPATTMRYFHQRPDRMRRRYDRATGAQEPAAERDYEGEDWLEHLFD